MLNGILISFSKHGAAVSLLQSLGGVEFFSRLRQDLSEDGHLELVDSILDSIFWLHEEEEQVHVNKNGTSTGTISVARSKSSQIPLDEKGHHLYIYIVKLDVHSCQKYRNNFLLTSWGLKCF